ncbi:MAG: glycerol dehydratase [Clostridia bacterium]|nr:glycerol dehydratase [Clostridia bacterium]
MIAKKPTIMIYTARPDEALLREVCAGIEEEGVLYEVVPAMVGDAAVLAAAASDASMLGSGVAVCGTTIALHIKGMEKGKTVLSYERASAAEARDAGANSARVIKRLPFKMGD